jgi:hypothetical protein
VAPFLRSAVCPYGINRNGGEAGITQRCGIGVRYLFLVNSPNSAHIGILSPRSDPFFLLEKQEIKIPDPFPASFLSSVKY